jgi:hypothetical protein
MTATVAFVILSAGKLTFFKFLSKFCTILDLLNAFSVRHAGNHGRHAVAHAWRRFLQARFQTYEFIIRCAIKKPK